MASSMVSNEFKEYVKQCNVEKIRRELLAILNSNPDMKDGQFKDSLKYAVDHLGEDKVFVPYLGDFQIKENKEEWTTTYVAEIFLQLRKEFSRKLVEHLEKVAPVVYGKKTIQRDLLQQTPQMTKKLPDTEKEKSSNFQGVCVKIAIAVLIILAVVLVGWFVIKV